MGETGLHQRWQAVQRHPNWPNLSPEEQTQRLDAFVGDLRAKFGHKVTGLQGFHNNVRARINSAPEETRFLGDAVNAFGDDYLRARQATTIRPNELRRILKSEYIAQVEANGSDAYGMAGGLAGGVAATMSKALPAAGAGFLIGGPPGAGVGFLGGSLVSDVPTQVGHSLRSNFFSQLDEGIDEDEAWSQSAKAAGISGVLTGAANVIPGGAFVKLGTKLVPGKGKVALAAKKVMLAGSSTRGGKRLAVQAIQGGVDDVVLEGVNVGQELAFGIDASNYRGTLGERVAIAGAAGTALRGTFLGVQKGATGIQNVRAGKKFGDRLFHNENVEAVLGGLDNQILEAQHGVRRREGGEDLEAAQQLEGSGLFGQRTRSEKLRALKANKELLLNVWDTITDGTMPLDLEVLAKEGSDGQDAQFNPASNSISAFLSIFEWKGDAIQRITLNHEAAHAHLRTLPPRIREKLRDLKTAEFAERAGPLFDADGNPRKNISKDLFSTDPERQFNEWYAERVSLRNDAWAKGRLSDAEANPIEGWMGNLARDFRVKGEKVGRSLGFVDGLDASFRDFLDAGKKYEFDRETRTTAGDLEAEINVREARLEQASAQGDTKLVRKLQKEISERTAKRQRRLLPETVDTIFFGKGDTGSRGLDDAISQTIDRNTRGRAGVPEPEADLNKLGQLGQLDPAAREAVVGPIERIKAEAAARSALESEQAGGVRHRADIREAQRTEFDAPVKRPVQTRETPLVGRDREVTQAPDLELPGQRPGQHSVEPDLSAIAQLTGRQRPNRNPDRGRVDPEGGRTSRGFLGRAEFDEAQGGTATASKSEPSVRTPGQLVAAAQRATPSDQSTKQGDFGFGDEGGRLSEPPTAPHQPPVESKSKFYDPDSADSKARVKASIDKQEAVLKKLAGRVDDAITNLAEPAQLHRLAKQAQENSFISKDDVKELRRIQREVGNKEDTSDALDELRFMLEDAQDFYDKFNRGEGTVEHAITTREERNPSRGRPPQDTEAGSDATPAQPQPVDPDAPLFSRRGERGNDPNRALVDQELTLSGKYKVVAGQTLPTAPPRDAGTSLEEQIATGEAGHTSYENYLKQESAALNANLIKDWSIMRNFKGGSVRQTYDELIRLVKGNLLALHDGMDSTLRARAKLWYEGANRIAQDFSARYKVTLEQASATMAVLSPQKDWFQNVSLAGRVLDIWGTKQNASVTPEMAKMLVEDIALRKTKEQKNMSTQREVLADRKERVIEAKQWVQLYSGKTLADITDDHHRAMFVRMWDEAHNPRSYAVLTPEGDRVRLQTNKDGSNSGIGWGSYAEINKAIKASQGDTMTIHMMLGDQHKVRNFYNNIADPTNPDHVTMDTHAIAAGLFLPLAGSSGEVANNFGSSGKDQPEFKNSNRGAKLHGQQGIYAVFAEAYRQAAKDRGLLAREMQSITWEQIRTLMSDSQKRQLAGPAKLRKSLVTGVETMALVPLRDPTEKPLPAARKVWKNTPNDETARQIITEGFGGFSLPDWAPSSYGSSRVKPGEAAATGAESVIVGGDDSTGVRTRRRRGSPQVRFPRAADLESLVQQRGEAAKFDEFIDRGGQFSRRGGDVEYQQLVDAGDTAGAQQAVDAAAKAAGFDPTPAFHRTWGEFRKFAAGGEEPRQQSWPDGDGGTHTLVGPSGRAVFLSYDAENTPAFHNSKPTGQRILRVYAKQKNPLVVDMDTKAWATDVFAGGHREFPQLITEGARQNLLAEGHDAIQFYQGERTPADGLPDELIVFNPSHIKSADPVTRDAAGVVVPLSRRFSTASDDINFSRRGGREENRPLINQELDPDSELLTRNFSDRAAGSDPELAAIRSKNPDIAFRDTQSIKDIQDGHAGRTDDDLDASVTRLETLREEGPKNTAILDGMERMRRAQDAGDSVGTKRVFSALAKAGTTIGQLLRQFREFKGAAATTHRLELMELQLLKDGRKMTPKQRDVMSRLINDDAKAKVVMDNAIEAALDNPTDRTRITAARKAESTENLAFRKLVNEARSLMPRKLRQLPADLLALIQGNLLTPVSTNRNAWGNYISMIPRLVGRIPATVADIVRAKFSKSGDRTVALPSRREAAWFTSGTLRGVRRAFESFRYGTSEDIIVGEVIRGFNPGKAFARAFTGNLPVDAKTGKVRVSDTVGKIFEGIFGFPAESMLRSLSALDELAKEGFRSQRAAEETQIRNVKRGTREFAEIELLQDAQTKAAADEQALQYTYQNASAMAKAAQSIDNALAATPVLGPTLRLGARVAFSPYVRTPINLFLEGAKFAVPGFGFAHSAAKAMQATHATDATAKRLLIRESQLSASYAIVGMSIAAVAEALIAEDLISGGPEGDTAENLVRSASGMGYFRMNMSGFFRMQGEEDAGYRPGDHTIRLDSLGVVGYVLAAKAEAARLQAKDPTQIPDPMVTKLGLDQIGTSIAMGRFAVNQTMLQGVSSLTSALERGSTHRWVGDKVNLISSIAMPNTVMAWRNTKEDAPKVNLTVPGDSYKTARNVLIHKFGDREMLLTKRDIFGKEITATPNVQYSKIPFASDEQVYHMLDHFKSESIANTANNALYAIYRDTGDDRVIPSVVSRNVTHSGQKMALTPELYDSLYADVQGAKGRAFVQISSSASWQNLAARLPGRAVDVLEKRYSTAGRIAKQAWQRKNRRELNRLKLDVSAYLKSR